MNDNHHYINFLSDDELIDHSGEPIESKERSNAKNAKSSYLANSSPIITHTLEHTDDNNASTDKNEFFEISLEDTNDQSIIILPSDGGSHQQTDNGRVKPKSIMDLTDDSIQIIQLGPSSARQSNNDKLSDLTDNLLSSDDNDRYCDESSLIEITSGPVRSLEQQSHSKQMIDRFDHRNNDHDITEDSLLEIFGTSAEHSNIPKKLTTFTIGSKNTHNGTLDDKFELLVNSIMNPSPESNSKLDDSVNTNAELAEEDIFKKFKPREKPKSTDVSVTESGTKKTSKSTKKKKQVETEFLPFVSEPISISCNGLRKYSQSDLNTVYDQTNTKILTQLNKKKSKEDIIDEIKLKVTRPLAEYLTKLNSDYQSLLSNSIEVVDDSEEIPFITFHRYVKAVFNEEKLTFVPVTPHWVKESFIIIVFEIDRFIELLPNHGLRNIIYRLKSQRGNEQVKIVIFVNNFEKYLLKLRNKINKKFDDITQIHLEQSQGRSNEMEPPASKRRKANKPQENSPLIEPNHLLIQVKKYLARSISIQPHAGYSQIATWINSYAYSIGKRPYDAYELNKNFAHLSSGKSGEGKEDTINKMLLSIPRLTERGITKMMQDNQLNDFVKLHSLFSDSQKHAEDKLKGIISSDVIKSLRIFFTSENENDLV